MKTIIAFIFSIICFAAAQAQGVANIADIAKQANAECPVDAGGGITLQSVAFDDAGKVYTLTYAVDGKTVDFKKVKSRAAMMHNTKLAEFTTDAANQKLREMCVSNGVAVAFVYACDGDSFAVTLTPDELK